MKKLVFIVEDNPAQQKMLQVAARCGGFPKA